ncbi:MAG: twin-arginine translocation signal domain-containing protein [Verrucomicrobia bacterium]|nr:twin-arginine translocation signal domain-containing protein [Verrucomicrobiota bacterium]
MSQEVNRREFIKDSLLAATAGALATGAAARAQSPAAQPAQSLPTGRIGADMQVSRVILGGNLVNLFTHSRDLNYVHDLAAQYHTDDRIFQTLAVAEEHGINTMSLSNRERAMGLLKRHRSERGGKMQWIVCPITKPDDSMTKYREEVERLVGDGADAVYMHGGMSDSLLATGRVDLIAKAVEIFKLQNVPCGVGAHDLGVVEACEKAGIPNDFYIKTFHHLDYPTAPRPEDMKKACTEVPGYWCKDWKAVAERMKSVKKTWIAFKVLAAGAIPPKKAFQWAFEGGGDHILVGMFDWQIAEDAALARESIEKAKAKRQRPWCS